MAEYDPYDTTGGLGGTASSTDLDGDAAVNVAALRGALARMPVQAAQQQAFYDRIAKQLEERRGPSTAEQLFQLSAALAAPTTVRGFSGVLNNVMPVLQKQAQAQREGATSREDALTALQLQQMQAAQGLTGQEVAYRTAVAKLAGANQNKIQLGADSALHEVPKDAYRPTNAAEFARVPLGAYYVVPGGPQAGQVIRKLQPTTALAGGF